MKNPQKPGELPRRGGFRNARHISDKRRKGLRELLPRRMSAKDSDAFLDRCSYAVQEAEWLASQTAAGVQRRQLRRLADSANRLLVAMAAAGDEARETFSVHGRYLSFKTEGPLALSLLGRTLSREDLPGDFVNDLREAFFRRTWDIVSDLEKMARYAADQYVGVSRQNKLDEANARFLVRRVAGAYREIIGKLPPKTPMPSNPGFFPDARGGGWFAGFMAELGEEFGFRCGPRIVKAVLVDMAREAAP